MFGAKTDEIALVILSDYQKRTQAYIDEAIRVWDSMHGTLPDFQTFMRVYRDTKHQVWLNNIRWN